jgi:hypothetical protein
MVADMARALIFWLGVLEEEEEQRRMMTPAAIHYSDGGIFGDIWLYRYGSMEVVVAYEERELR